MMINANFHYLLLLFILMISILKHNIQQGAHFLNLLFTIIYAKLVLNKYYIFSNRQNLEILSI